VRVVGSVGERTEAQGLKGQEREL